MRTSSNIMLHYKVFGRQPVVRNLIRFFETSTRVNSAPTHVLPFIRRLELSSAVENALLNQSQAQTWVIGPGGCGKRWTLVYACNQLKNSSKNRIPPVLIPFDFEPERHVNFQILLWKIFTTFREHLVGACANLDLSCEWIFRCLQPQFPDFSERILLLVKSLVTANKATSSILSSKIDSMLQQRLNRFVEKLESKPLDEYFWRDFVELMLQQRSSAFSNFTGNHDTLNMALYLMVCTSTMGWDEAGKEYIQPTLFQSSSELGMAYFLCLLQSLCFTYHIPVCVVLMNVELFYRSSYLRTGGGASFFDSFTHSILKIYPVPHIFATSDALFTLQNFKHIMANSSLGESSSSPEKPTMNEFPSLSMDVEASPLTRIHTSIIQIPEWTKAMARAAFIPSLLDSESLFESIWEAVGGNVKLLEKIASDLRIQKLQLDAEQMKYAHNEKGEEMLLKDVGFDYADLTTKSSFKELLELQKTLKLNALIRNLPEKTLRSDVLQFEWKMNQFFSLKLIEDLRLQMQNSISFYSTVFETIRLLLHQPYTYCQDVEAMKHPIILGLLDVNILTVAFLPTRFSITDRFTYNLLRSYLELHYESLSWRDKMRYTTTTWINRKAYKNALLRLEKSL